MKKTIMVIMCSITLVMGLCSCTNNEAGDTELPEVVANTPGHEKWEEPIDYSDAANWLNIPENTDKDVDVIYYYPTTFAKAENSESCISDIDDETMRKGAMGCLESQASVFKDSCNVFAPFYRQVDGGYGLTITDEENAELFKYAAMQDAANALDYYFENYNEGRPFILAGHSQGSETSIFLLQEYFKDHPDYYEKMVAAYVIGYSVTEKFLSDNPELKFAEKSDDTGVIISWNTEGPGNVGQHNVVVLDGAKAINPINWKTDDTYASTDENLGSLINGEIQYGVADAQVNLERGSVITNADKSFAMASNTELFGPECFHGYDYGFYYNNIKQNVKDRIEAYKNSKAGR